VKAAAKVVKPLTDTLQGGLQPQAKIQWTAAQQQAFQAAKDAIAAATQLVHPLPAAVLALVTHASGTRVGTCCSSGSVDSHGGRWGFSRRN
jgi:hypothetical protein